MNDYDPKKLLTALNQMIEINDFTQDNPVIPNSRERLKECLQILTEVTDCNFAFIVELEKTDGHIAPVPETLVSTRSEERISEIIETLTSLRTDTGRRYFADPKEVEAWAIASFERISTFCAIPVYMDDTPVSLVCLANRQTGFTGTEATDLAALVRFVCVVYRALHFFGIAADTVAEQLGRRAVATQSNIWFGRKDMWTGLSHDLNGIFAVIALQAELLRTQLESPEAISKGLDRIDMAIDQIGQLTARLDLLGQLQGSEMRPTPLLDGARTFEFLSKFLFAHSGQLVLTIDCPVETHVPLSGRELLTILHALLSNSFEANAKDLMPVYVDIYFESDRTVSLKVTNSGPRFDEEVLKHLFSRKITTHKDADGKADSQRGFGLLAVKTLIDEIGGTISLESTDVATQVIVTFPIAPSPSHFDFYQPTSTRLI